MTPRQRLRFDVSAFAGLAARLLVALVAVALVYYGAMLVLLALKVDPGTVDSLSGYRDAYDFLADLDADEINRAILAGAGLATAALAGLLAWRALPRPRLARAPVRLGQDPRGETIVRPQAIERAAEIAALQDPRVRGARARLDEGGVVLEIAAQDPATIVETMGAAKQRARAALARHEVPCDRVDVTLTRHFARNEREIA